MDVSAFASVLVVLASIFLLLILSEARPFHHGGATLARVTQPIPMPSALREDAIIVTIFRDSRVVFANQIVTSDQLPALILESLKDGSERKVYIRADARAKYKTISEVVDGVQMAGIQNIAFLVEERLTSGSRRLAKTP